MIQQPAGILQDDQWNTYDEALHGVTTFISGYYLAALRAGKHVLVEKPLCQSVSEARTM